MSCLNQLLYLNLDAPPCPQSRWRGESEKQNFVVFVDCRAPTDGLLPLLKLTFNVSRRDASPRDEPKFFRAFFRLVASETPLLQIGGLCVLFFWSICKTVIFVSWKKRWCCCGLRPSLD